MAKQYYFIRSAFMWLGYLPDISFLATFLCVDFLICTIFLFQSILYNDRSVKESILMCYLYTKHIHQLASKETNK